MSKGYTFDKARQKWLVRYQSVYYGRYDTLEEAKAALTDAQNGVPKCVPTRVEKIVKDCVWCGDTFTSFPSLDRVTACLVTCAQKYRYLTQTHPQKGRFKPVELLREARAKRDTDYIQRRRFRGRLQRAVFIRDNFTCQICSQYSGNLQVDHIKSWSEYPELRFEIDNCRTLCMACHYYITFKRKMPEGIVWGHNLSRRIMS